MSTPINEEDILLSRRQSTHSTYLVLNSIKHELLQSIDLEALLVAKLLPSKALEKLSKDKLLLHLSETIDNKEARRRARDALRQEANNLFRFDSRRLTYLVDCLKETLAGSAIANFTKFYLRPVGKEVTRLIWEHSIPKLPSSEQQTLLKVTGQKLLTNFNKIVISLASSRNIKLKDPQTQLGDALMQYYASLENRNPQKTLTILVVLFIDLFSFYSIRKLSEARTMLNSLIGFSKSYELAPNQGLLLAMETLDLIDPQTCAKIQAIIDSEGPSSIIELIKNFVQSFGAVYLSFEVSCLIVTQLLIKHFNIVDIYAFFAIMMLLVGDYIEQSEGLYSLNKALGSCHQQISLKDYSEAYAIVYERIPLQLPPLFPDEVPNKLLDLMIKHNTGKKEILLLGLYANDPNTNAIELIDSKQQATTIFEEI